MHRPESPAAGCRRRVDVRVRVASGRVDGQAGGRTDAATYPAAVDPIIVADSQLNLVKFVEVFRY